MEWQTSTVWCARAGGSGGKKPASGWGLIFTTDATGNSPMSLAAASGNEQWMTSYVNKDSLSFCHEQHLSYQTRCKHLSAAGDVLFTMLSSQKLGALRDPLSELLKLLIVRVEKNPHSVVQPPALGSPSIQLQPVVSSDIWWPEDRPVPAETGYKIDLTAEAFMMPKVMSPEFLSRLCEEDVPDVLAVFSCNPIAAAITFKWQTWRLFFLLSSSFTSFFRLCICGWQSKAPTAPTHVLMMDQIPCAPQPTFGVPKMPSQWFLAGSFWENSKNLLQEPWKLPQWMEWLEGVWQWLEDSWNQQARIGPSQQ